MNQPKEGPHRGPILAEIMTTKGPHLKLRIPSWSNERNVTVRGKHLRRALGDIQPGQDILLDAVLGASSPKRTNPKNFRRVPAFAETGSVSLRIPLEDFPQNMPLS